MNRTIVKVGKALFLGALLMGVGCDDPFAPYEPEITNAADSFQFQATGIENVNTNTEYTWQMSGTTANVNQATVLASGTARLEIRDNAGTLVYSRSLTDNGTYVTSAGVAGSWKIRLVLANAYGTLNFRVQKP